MIIKLDKGIKILYRNLIVLKTSFNLRLQIVYNNLLICLKIFNKLNKVLLLLNQRKLVNSLQLTKRLKRPNLIPINKKYTITLFFKNPNNSKRIVKAWNKLCLNI